MEDLLIAPWQNQNPNNLVEYYGNSNKHSVQLTKCPPVKNRFIHTDSDDRSEDLLKKKNFHISIRRKNGQSSSTCQFSNERKDKSVPSRVQIKLVSYPIQEKIKLRQTIIRYSYKLEAIPKQKLSNQSFQAIQNIYSSDKKYLKELKVRTFHKHHTYSESSFKNRFRNKVSNKQHQLFNFRRSAQQSHSNQDEYQTYIDCSPVEQLKLEIEKKYNKLNLKDILRKSSANKKKFQKYSLSHNDHQQKQVNNTFDVSQFQRFSNSRNFLESDKQRKSVRKLRKLSVQKLQNIDCLKDNTNIFTTVTNVFTTLKKKNKKNFNELEKYNLFGLRKMKKNNSEN